MSVPPIEELLKEEEYRIYDILIAVMLSICTLVGLPGNVLSLTYFFSASRRDFSSFIYTIVCGIDIWTCVVHLPVMVALYNTREPEWFGVDAVCVGWIVVFYYLQKMSMFLVMLMSVSRTITLIYLRYKIKKKFLVIACLAYSAFYMIWEFIVYIVGGSHVNYNYSQADGYCWRYIPREEEYTLHKFDKIVRSICIGIPSILTIISFTVVTYKLLQKSKVSSKNQSKHKAAVTMAMFTGLFLTCNLLCLVQNVMSLASFSLYNSHQFWKYYSWLLSDIVTTVLNAALNPVLYIIRMDKLREWVTSRCSRRVLNRRSSESVPDMQRTTVT